MQFRCEEFGAVKKKFNIPDCRRCHPTENEIREQTEKNRRNEEARKKLFAGLEEWRSKNKREFR